MATAGTNFPTGRYRASTAGGAFPGNIRTDHGGRATSFEHVRGGLPPANVNGAWTLNVSDVATGDFGSLIGATLSVFDQGDALFRASFVLPVRGTCKLAWLD